MPNINASNNKLTEDEIIAQCIIVFAAGYETTGSLLSYCCYELALNQDIQERLYNEIKSVVDANGYIDYDTLMKLPYLDAVISETLRKYPPAIRLSRTSTVDYPVPEYGITIPKHQTVIIPVYSMHHNEAYFPNAEQYKPERFLPENRSQIKPFTYIPFGGGPRTCVAMRFALMEAKLGLARIVNRYVLFQSSGTVIPLEFRRDPVLLVAKKVIVGIKMRA